MLDVSKQCRRPKKIDNDSSLAFFAGTLLVDIYRYVSDEPAFTPAQRLIPGLFIMNNLMKSGQWTIIDHTDVDPHEVEFPETLANVQGRLCFQRGEVVLPFSTHVPLLDSLNVYPTMVRAERIPMLANYYLHQAGLIELVDAAGMSHLAHSDLRFTPHRNEVYALLGEPANEPYHVMARRFGHDITRFY